MKSLFSQKNQLENIKEEVFGNDRLFFLKIANYKFLNHLFEYYKKDNDIKISKFSIFMQNLDPKMIMIITFIPGAIAYCITANTTPFTVFVVVLMFLISSVCIYLNIRYQIKKAIKSFILEDSTYQPQHADALLHYTKVLIANNEKEHLLKNCDNDEISIKKKRL